MEFTGEELKELIQGLNQRVMWYEKLYANRLQLAEEKGGLKKFPIHCRIFLLKFQI